MTDEGTYDAIVDRNLKRFQTAIQKKAIINDIAKEFEDQGMRLERISSEIKRRLRDHYDDVQISDKWVTESLYDRYKRPKKQTVKQTVHNGSHSQSSSTTNEPKKEIEVLAGTNTQTTSEPQQPNTNNDPNLEDILDPETLATLRQPGHLLDQDAEDLKKELAEKDTQIKNLENQLKIIRERKPEPVLDNQTIEIKNAMKKLSIPYEYEPNKLENNDGKIFKNVIVANVVIMEWLKKTIPDLIAKYGKGYFLIQQNLDNPMDMRINYLKTQFITGNPH